MSDSYVDYLVVGGGVAGVCCAKELSSLLINQRPETAETRVVGLVSGRSGYVKVVTNVERLTEMMTVFDVAETTADALIERIHVFQHDVCAWNAQEQTVYLSDGSKIHFVKLCIATGARPKRALSASSVARANILTLRDVESIERLRTQISSGRQRRVVIVGNGGIATELAFELEGVKEIVWAIRDGTISSTFFDEAASRFFAPKLAAGRRAETTPKPESRLDRFTVYQRPQPWDGASKLVDIGSGDRPPQSEYGSSKSDDRASTGCALGPHWLAKLGQRHDDSILGERHVRVIRNARVRQIYATGGDNGTVTVSANDNGNKSDASWPIWVEFEPISPNGEGERIGADFVMEATGVMPNSELWARDCAELKIASDGGIYVDEMLRTTVPNVYAAGDVCTMENRNRPHWMQIRLWTQARQMGLFCARSMVIENLLPDICFDLLTHVTTSFGYKVVLLGDFLGAKLSPPYEVHYRISPSSSSRKRNTRKEKSIRTEEEDVGEYVKVLTCDGRVHGAVLVGETDLEETMENLILDQTDITAIEPQLLEPSIDLEDYFD